MKIEKELGEQWIVSEFAEYLTILIRKNQRDFNPLWKIDRCGMIIRLADTYCVVLEFRDAVLKFGGSQRRESRQHTVQTRQQSIERFRTT
jgi:hypothetical protein